MADLVYGFDRADGKLNLLGNPNPGTPTPDNAWMINGKVPDVFLEELPTSPTFEIAEHVTVTHKFACDKATAMEQLAYHPRGTMVTDSFGLQYAILSASYEMSRGGFAVITLTMEGAGATADDPTGGFDPPPAECTIEPVELNPPIWYHPRYRDVRRYNLDDRGRYIGATAEDGTPSAPSGYDLIRLCQSAANSAQHEYMRDNLLLLSLDNVPDLEIRRKCAEIVCKLRKGESEFYLAGWKVQFTYYSWMPPYLCPGGFIQDPVYSGELPWWVWSTLGDPAADPDLDSIFNGAAVVNPAIYAQPDNPGVSSISWFRFADHREWSRVWWRTAETWVGGPLGSWDKDLYPVYVDRFDTGESDLDCVNGVLP